MAKIEAFIEIGYWDADYKEVFEVNDDMTDEEIDKIISNWAFNHVCIGWNRIEENE